MYLQILNELQEFAESEFAMFQQRLIPTKRKILGVRTPTLRKIAKRHTGDIEEIFALPNEYYEVVFIKLAIVASLPYDRFLQYLARSVELIDNWALCDCFKAKCIKAHKEEFLSVLADFFEQGTEFAQRYVLVTLLSEYVEMKYLPIIESYLKAANTKPYYVHMAVAWLMAEILIKYYEEGVRILKNNDLATKTHNKAIQKAIEGYPLTKEQKEFLRSLKIK